MFSKNKIYITLTVFCILSGALIVFIIYPVIREIRKEAEELIVQRRETVLIERKLKNFEEFKQLYQEIRSDLKKTDFLFINPDVPVEFFGFLKRNAVYSQVSMDIAHWAVNENRAEASLMIDGSFPNFLKFLERLETGFYLIEVLNIHVRKIERIPGHVLPEEAVFALNGIRASVLIKVYTK